MKPIGRFTPSHDTSRASSPTNSTPTSNPEIKSEFLSKSQQQALLSGNANEIKQANAKALAEAVQNSLNEQPTHTKTPASKRKISSDEWSAHAKNKAKENKKMSKRR
jgi:hypothetical protein